MEKKRLNMRLLTQACHELSNTQMSGTFRMSQQRFRLKTKETIQSSRKLLKSTRKMADRIETISENYMQIIKEEILSNNSVSREQDLTFSIILKLTKAFKLCEKINSDFYPYKTIQNSFKELNDGIKLINSLSLEFKAFALTGFCFFEYGNFSLTIYYLDRALKTLYSKNFIYAIDLSTQIIIYKYISKVFLTKGNFKDARDFAYKYLRKSWSINDIDEEMNAFDLLGVIESESGNIELGKYFHWRMCRCIKQKNTMKLMSNQELQKIDNEKFQSSCYQNILIFVNKHEKFHEILDKYYRSQSSVDEKELWGRPKTKNIFMYTHRSLNRNLNNFHLLQRKLICEKSSKQIHFIKPRQIKKMRKLVSDFNSIIFHVRKLFQLQKSLELEEEIDYLITI